MEIGKDVVCLEYRVNKSFEGKYFMGHTPVVTLGRTHAWGGVFNPENSGVNLYICTFTVSNFSAVPFQSQLWITPDLHSGEESPFAACANAVKKRRPKGCIRYAQGVSDTPSGGASLFTRIAGPHSTEVGNYYGKIVVPPGGSFVAFLYAPGAQRIKAEVALGWWEE